MATMIAFTPRGTVEHVHPIHKQDLAKITRLPSWVCEKEHFHDRDYDPLKTTPSEFDAFDKQIEQRGYCDGCRDFSARLIREFKR
jgi:hypothetical protein